MIYKIWIEGYAITGNRANASYEGEAEANSFNEACELLKGNELDRNSDGTLRDGRPSIWGCRLFDNESDSRKSFG